VTKILIDDHTENVIDKECCYEATHDLRLSIFNTVCDSTPAVMATENDTIPLPIEELPIAMSRCVDDNSGIDERYFDYAFFHRVSNFAKKLIGEMTDPYYSFRSFAITLKRAADYCSRALMNKEKMAGWLLRYFIGYIAIFIYLFETDDLKKAYFMYTNMLPPEYFHYVRKAKEEHIDARLCEALSAYKKTPLFADDKSTISGNHLSNFRHLLCFFLLLSKDKQKALALEVGLSILHKAQYSWEKPLGEYLALLEVKDQGSKVFHNTDEFDMITDYNNLLTELGE
jgi:hypothetical protein